MTGSSEVMWPAWVKKHGGREKSKENKRKEINGDE